MTYDLTSPQLLIGDFRVPTFFYGTAWKEGESSRLTELAIAHGFRGIDTANQRKHYHEAGVGEGIQRAMARGIKREDLFLQSKFTHVGGQDHRLPYDVAAPLPQQVQQSFAKSLEHLGTSYLDSFVLHGPSSAPDFGLADLEVWRAMEAIHLQGNCRFLGVSNVSAHQLNMLLERAKIKPTFVQNRCYADRGWDGEVRRTCRQHGMIYQGFSLLTANRRQVAGPIIGEIAARHKKTPTQVVFRFAQQLGMLPLTGTTNESHMRLDLDAYSFRMNAEELAAIEQIQ